MGKFGQNGRKRGKFVQNDPNFVKVTKIDQIDQKMRKIGQN